MLDMRILGDCNSLIRHLENASLYKRRSTHAGVKSEKVPA
jgi:hypothetical protein